MILANDQPIPLVLLANKVTPLRWFNTHLQCDLEDSHVPKEDLDEFCKQNGFLTWFETSALSDTNIGMEIRRLWSTNLER